MGRLLQAAHLTGCGWEGEHRGEDNSEGLNLSGWEGADDLQWFREEKEERSIV